MRIFTTLTLACTVLLGCNSVQSISEREADIVFSNQRSEVKAEMCLSNELLLLSYRFNKARSDDESLTRFALELRTSSIGLVNVQEIYAVIEVSESFIALKRNRGGPYVFGDDGLASALKKCSTPS